MREIAATGDVVRGQPLQAPLAQAIGAGVADVNDVAQPPRQDDRGEGATHTAEQRIGAALRVDPAIGGFQRARGPAAHAKCFGKGIIGVDEASNRELGSFASALVSADAVGDRGDDVTVAPTGPAEAGPDVILIGGALAGLADEADANPEISLRTDRHPRGLSS